LRRGVKHTQLDLWKINYNISVYISVEPEKGGLDVKLRNNFKAINEGEVGGCGSLVISEDAKDIIN